MEEGGDSNTLAYTPRYTSREQADGLILTAGDIWSLGLICYEVLTRRKPWEGLQPI